MSKNQDYKPITRFDADDEEVEVISLKHGELACFSDRSPMKDTPNEDALAIIPVDDEITVLAVADGMGGMPVGEQASMIVIESLINALSTAKDEQQTRIAILNGIDEANKNILDLKTGAGTTVSVAEIYQNQLRTYHAGDSLILLTSSHGNIKYQSMPHSPIGYALECGAINQENAMVHQERNIISNYVGSNTMHIHLGPLIELAPQDTIILASDALSDNLYEQEISEFIRKGPLLESVNGMIAECQNNMLKAQPDRRCHPDDFTFICFRQNT